jgi:hypothetical protein
MTEEEWLASQNANPMLGSLFGHFTCRKLRLFCLACCYEKWDVFADPRERRVLHVAKRMVEGEASEEECKAARDLWRAFYEENRRRGYNPFAPNFLPETVIWSNVSEADAASFADSVAYMGIFRADGFERLLQLSKFDQATFLRDIVGNPFRPVAFDSRWRTADAVGLARGVYEERAFERLPLLADALMDAGCGDEQVLSHCRSEGPHVRGCWVVDLVLGKE